jgi:heme exporter protein D
LKTIYALVFGGMDSAIEISFGITYLKIILLLLQTVKSAKATNALALLKA